MMNHQEAIQVVDMELTALIPEMRRKMYREQVTERMDILLDMRNELVFQMGLVVLEQELEWIKYESEAVILDGTTG